MRPSQVRGCTPAYYRPGGVYRDLPDHDAANTKVRSSRTPTRSRAQRQPPNADFLEDFCNRFPTYVDEYETLLTDNRIWKQRTVGIGVVTPEQALAWGFTGPCCAARASNGTCAKQPYEVYDKVDFDIPVGGQRRLLRPLPGAHGRDAPVEPHHQAVHRLAAQGQPRSGDHRQPQGGAAIARKR